MSVYVPLRLLNLVKRLFGLRSGSYVLLLNITDDGLCTYEVIARGQIEK